MIPPIARVSISKYRGPLHPDGIEMHLDDSIYLGDKREYRLRRGDFVAKAHGARQLASGNVWARIPAESVWVFAAAAPK
ncbi:MULTISPECIES: hypothetical protein [unclassified Mesorhizobium]|uniref:hypothetical protein n=1 Tax=unclassified Mesorhizobium TaxID=325217 RepID=UPI0008022204|nr:MULTISPECIES: hypothetical protein [unclassified Mesorhizobium]MCT2577875.1 hypothetical protein [Mesorhizobium sp. P13.3]MDF3166813.1 hypothetical protein [Mesorhizobium sp. P16.1]MDF3180294.1 hypothetical protein [Mesorhizobium sp. P17.1]MDF3184098.1 hypothetical protein [Mesorhizobium sp. ICCV3110.1]MDG4908842.1 hypothetical protein [Mesorhizobium sp. WSM4898]